MLRRHDLLRPGRIAWDALLRRRPDLKGLPGVAEWAELGRSVIVRRRLPGDGAHDVTAALPLPPSCGTRRIAICFPPGAELSALPPVLLRDVAAAAPDAWQQVIATLVAAGESIGVAPCVFGSLLWQHATGLPYLTPQSDLDLLWPVADEAAAEALAQTLIRLDGSAPIRLDGELVLPDGAGVNWRELAEADVPEATVLVKTMNGVGLRPKTALFRSLAPA